MLDKTFLSLPNRRQILKQTGMLMATIPFMADAVPAKRPVLTGVVDCHIHLWAADKKRFPFHPDAPYIPEHVSTVEQWLSDRQNSGIDIGIFVHPEPYQDDHRYVIHCMEQAPGILYGTCLFNPNAPESLRQLAELVKGRNFVAARVHASGTLNSAEWDNPHFEAFWEKVGELDIVLQLHMHPKWSREFERMVRKYPDIRVVVDHIGRPRQGDAVDYEIFLGISAYPNVYVKISSLESQSLKGPPYENLKLLLKEIVRRFGTRRLIWGDSYRGDMGSAEYAKSVAIAAHLLDFLPAEELRWIFVENPRRLFKL